MDSTVTQGHICRYTDTKDQPHAQNSVITITIKNRSGEGNVQNRGSVSKIRNATVWVMGARVRLTRSLESLLQSRRSV